MRSSGSSIEELASRLMVAGSTSMLITVSPSAGARICCEESEGSIGIDTGCRKIFLSGLDKPLDGVRYKVEVFCCAGIEMGTVDRLSGNPVDEACWTGVDEI